MKGKIKLVMLGCAVVVALSAATGTAQAAQFHSPVDYTTVKGSQKTVHYFTNGWWTVTCSTAEFHGETAETTYSEMTMTETDSGCHVIILFTFSAASRKNSCDWIFYADGSKKINCTKEGDSMEFESAGCTIRIPEQTIESGVSYENTGSGITVTEELEGIAYTQEGGTCGSAEGENGTYTGTTLLTGEDEEGEAVEIWWE